MRPAAVPSPFAEWKRPWVTKTMWESGLRSNATENSGEFSGDVSRKPGLFRVRRRSAACAFSLLRVDYRRLTFDSVTD
jgi:hypothetical protein